jgi:hypothetical protein
MQKTLLNGSAALAILVYGWVCWQNDFFYMPNRHRISSHPWLLHGVACKLLVGFLVCIAILFLLPVIQAYLKPKQRCWCDKAWWPVAYSSLGLLGAGLAYDLVFN